MKQNCDLKKCYKCSEYEDCEVRFLYHAAPVLLGIMAVGLIGVAASLIFLFT